MNTEKIQEKFKADIEDWMESFVEVNHQKLDGWPPCPYAKKARLSKTIRYIYVDENSFFEEVTKQCTHFSEAFEVIVVGTQFENIKVDLLWDYATQLRKRVYEDDIWPLFDHPDDAEVINGLKMNNGQYLLSFIQKKSSLVSASKELKEKGYYNVWEKEHYDLVVKQREAFGEGEK